VEDGQGLGGEGNVEIISAVTPSLCSRTGLHSDGVRVGLRALRKFVAGACLQAMARAWRSITPERAPARWPTPKCIENGGTTSVSSGSWSPSAHAEGCIWPGFDLSVPIREISGRIDGSRIEVRNLQPSNLPVLTHRATFGKRRGLR